MVIRKRELPGSTVGGRMPWIKIPAARNSSLSSMARPASPTMTGIIGVGSSDTLKSGSPTRRSIDEVLAGRADYGVARSELLLHRLHGEPLVALAAVFQHSAIVFLAKKDSKINTPQDMIGRKVMLLPGNDAAEYMAVFRNEGIAPDQVEIIPSSFEINDLLEGKTDVFNAYVTNEPYYLKQRNIPATVIKPVTYGIDLYRVRRDGFQLRQSAIPFETLQIDPSPQYLETPSEHFYQGRLVFVACCF